MFHNKKGFTLIEMLVVIAVIAVLVAIVVPTVTSSTQKAKAATDAANLRAIVSQLNITLVGEDTLAPEAVASLNAPDSSLNPGAELKVLYRHPGFIAPYYITSDGKYYGLDYLAEMASGSTHTATLDAPAAQTGDQWYTIAPDAP